jgi:DNA-directed RNA polymerase specialized sigma subunit
VTDPPPLTARQQRLVEQLTPQVHVLVRSFGYGLSHTAYPDLVQVGHLRLCVVVHDFDPTRGTTWKTFATVAVRRAIMDYIEYSVRRNAAPLESHPPARPEETELDAGEVVGKLPRLYARAARAGSVAAVARLGFTRRTAEKVLECTERHIKRQLDDRA